MIKILKAPLLWLRNLYDWVLKWGNSKHSRLALFILALVEASFFPVPADILLIALCIGNYKRWINFALICSVGSIIGGVLGYLIGHFAFDLIGEPVLSITAQLSGVDSQYLLKEAQYWFSDKEIIGMHVGAWAVGIAGFTPIPYKVFTIAAGFFSMSFVPFLIASAISRTLRFFIVAGIIGLLYEKYGKKITDFIDRYFNYLAIVFVILLVFGFFILKYL